MIFTKADFIGLYKYTETHIAEALQPLVYAAHGS